MKMVIIIAAALVTTFTGFVTAGAEDVTMPTGAKIGSWTANWIWQFRPEYERGCRPEVIGPLFW